MGAGNEGRGGIGVAANVRFKARSAGQIWPALVLAVLAHYAALAWMPAFGGEPVGSRAVAREVRLVDVLPEVRLPPAPDPISPPPMPAVVEVDFAEEVDLEPVDFGETRLPPIPPPPVVPASDGEAARFVLSSVAPELKNRRAVARALERHYPPRLVDAGIGGTVVFWFWIEADGRVHRYELKQSSGHAALDEAAERVIAVMEFSPAIQAGRAVPVLVALPIVFQVR